MLVYIPAENRVGRVESQMAYGAIIRYDKGGIEYHELMSEEDYEPFYALDDAMEETYDD